MNDTSSEMERQVTERYKLMTPDQSAHMTFALAYLTRTDCRMLGIAQIPPPLPHYLPPIMLHRTRVEWGRMRPPRPLRRFATLVKVRGASITNV